MSLFQELKRRNVFRVGIAYAVAAWILLQLVDVIGQILEMPAWVGKLILLLLAAGIVPALILAWAFEMTPEGLKREADVDRSQSIAPQTGKKLNTLILVLMAMAIGYLLYDKFSRPATNPAATASEPATAAARPPAQPAAAEPTVSPQSIAVLPFENRSDNKSDEYFTEGIHDDLLTSLARIGSIKVISRTSVMRYKNSEKPIPEIAKELGVATVMEGAVQRSGDQVRINVQLINAQTDEHMWAQIYDRKLTADNLFAIQSEISSKIASALQAALSPEEQQQINRKPTDNLAAYDAYLHGRQLMASRTSSDLEQALSAFKSAVQLDPKFALAWVGVADANNLLTSYSTLPATEAIAAEEDAVKHAMALDPALGEAYASLAEIHKYYQRNDEAEAAYRKAIELSPNYAQAYHWYANFLIQFPLRARDTLNFANKAAELDPNSAIIGMMLSGAYEGVGLNTLAEQQIRKVIDLHPGFANARIGLAQLQIFTLGQFDKGLVNAQKGVDMDSGNIAALMILYAAYFSLEDQPGAAKVLSRMQDLDANSPLTAVVTVYHDMRWKNPKATEEAINWAAPMVQNDPGQTLNLSWTEATLGNFQRARLLALDVLPGWLERDQWPKLIGQYPGYACSFAFLLTETGEPDLGAALLQQSLKYFDEELPKVTQDVDSGNQELCYALNGDKERALATVETNLAHNHLFNWKVKYALPPFDLIRDDPRYQAAVAERNRRVAEQAQRVAQMKEPAAP